MQRQTEPYTLQQYMEAGCAQFRNGTGDLIALGLFLMTDGFMCNGCPAMRDRNGCESFKKLSRPVYVHLSPKAPAETVRQEAARRGISIGEVRRQRQAALVSA
jgi:hypothetical protein